MPIALNHAPTFTDQDPKAKAAGRKADEAAQSGAVDGCISRVDASRVFHRLGSSMGLLFSFKGRVNCTQCCVVGFVLMLSWLVIWAIVASTVYRVDSMPFAFLGAAVSFMFVAAAGSAIAIKRLYDRCTRNSELPTFAGLTERFRPGL